MPKLCRTKVEAALYVREKSDEDFPAVVLMWTANDIREAYLDADDEPVLTADEVVEVLARLADNHDATLGITHDRVWEVCDYVFHRRGKK